MMLQLKDPPDEIKLTQDFWPSKISSKHAKKQRVDFDV
jgi:hypothetical protein